MLARLTAFLLPLAAVVVVVQQMPATRTAEVNLPTTADLMRRSFDGAARRSYEAIVLGNSRMFRGVNPDKLGVSAYNFAFDNDSFNQVYYKLQYLEARGIRPATLIIGIDYFEFSIVSDIFNREYGPYLGPEYLRDYAPGSAGGANRHRSRFLHPIDEDRFNAYMKARFTAPAARLQTAVLERLLGDPPPPAMPRRFMRDNGQYVVDGELRRDFDLIRRDATRQPFQVRCFEKTLAFARDHHLAAVLVMPPMRDTELKSYGSGVVAEFDAWLAGESRGIPYLNYASHPAFSLADFTDVTHLSEAGADKFSTLLGRDLEIISRR